MTIEVEQMKIRKKEKHLTELVINRVLVRECLSSLVAIAVLIKVCLEYDLLN